MKVLEGRVAAPLVKVMHEGRPVSRRQHGPLASDNRGPLGIARVLRIFPRRVGLDEGAAQAAREAHAFAVHVSACTLPEFECRREFAEFDADFLQHRVGVVFDQFQRFGIEDFEMRNPALDPACVVIRGCAPAPARRASASRPRTATAAIRVAPEL